MPDIYGTIESLARSVQDSLTSKTIYGDPITAGAVTVVPVAKVAFGFGGGGGGGSGPPTEDGAPNGGSGGGGGGGGGVEPIGFIEITESGSRWVPVEPPQSTQFLKALGSASRLLPDPRQARHLRGGRTDRGADSAEPVLADERTRPT